MLQKNPARTAASLRLRLHGPVFRTALLILVLLLPVAPAMGVQTTTIENKQYTGRNLYRELPAADPDYFEYYHTFSYSLVTWQETWIVYSYDPYTQGYIYHSTHHSASSASAAKPTGGTITHSNVQVSRQDGLTDEEVVSRETVVKPPGDIPPDELPDTTKKLDEEKSDGDEALDELEDLDDDIDYKELVDLLEGDVIRDEADEEEQEALLRQKEEEQAVRSHPYGDPVKLATGSLFLSYRDLFIRGGGRDADLSLDREYHSPAARPARTASGDAGSLSGGAQTGSPGAETTGHESGSAAFFGPGWSSNLEMRLLIGRSAPRIAPVEELEAAIQRLSTQKTQLERDYDASLSALDAHISTLNTAATELRTMEGLYKNLYAAATTAAGREGYRRIVRRYTEEALCAESYSSTLTARRKTIVETEYPEIQRWLGESLRQLEDQLQERRTWDVLDRQLKLRNALLSPDGVVSASSGAADLTGYGSLILYLDGSRPLLFVHPGRESLSAGTAPAILTGSYSCADIPQYRLQLNEGGEAVLSLGGGHEILFAADGRPWEQRLNGRILFSFRYQAPWPGPVELSYPDGRQVEIGWEYQETAGVPDPHSPGRARIVSVRGPGGELSYAYADGRLSSVRYPDGRIIAYGYEADSACISSVALTTSASGSRVQSRNYAYDSSGRVSAVTDSAGLDESFTYACDPQGRISRATYLNSLRQELQVFFNERGQRIRELSEEGESRTWLYDDRGNPVLITIASAGGSLESTQLAYDSRGLLTSLRDPLTSAFHRMQYNAEGQLILRQDPDGVAVSYDYDERGNLIHLGRMDGSSCSWIYDGDDRMTGFTNEEDKSWTYVYDHRGYRSEIHDPCGGITRFRYDDAGTLTGWTSPEGRHHDAVSSEGQAAAPGSAANPDTAATGGAADPEASNPGGFQPVLSPGRRPRSLELDDGGYIRWAYDERGLLSTINYPDGSYEAYEYSPAGLLRRMRDRRGGSTIFEYDACGRLSAVESPLGIRTEYTRDLDGLVTRRVQGVSEANPSGLHCLEAVFDDVGNLTLLREGGGPDSMKTTLVQGFDSRGRLISSTNAMDETWNYEYSPAPGYFADPGSSSGAGTEAGAQPGAAGGSPAEIRIARDPLGLETVYGINARGQIMSVQAPGMQELRLYYNDDGLLSAETMGGEDFLRYSYDTQGNITSMHRPDSADESFDYDSGGRLRGIQAGELQVTMEYHALYGSLSSRTLSDGGTYRYGYDGLGNLVREEFPGGATVEYRYSQGLLLQREDFTAGPDGRASSVLRYSHDAAGRLRNISDIQGNMLKEFDFDDLGRLVSAVSPASALEIRYNQAGRLAESRDRVSGAQLSYGFDAAGRLISLEDDAGMYSVLSLDAAGRTGGLRLVDGPRYSIRRDRLSLQVLRDEAGRITTIAPDDPREDWNIRLSYGRTIRPAGISFTSRPGRSATPDFAEFSLMDGSDRHSIRLDNRTGLSRYRYDDSNRLEGVIIPWTPESLLPMLHDDMDMESLQELEQLIRSHGIVPSAMFRDNPRSPVMLQDETGGTASVCPEVEHDAAGRVTRLADATGTRLMEYDLFGRLRSLELQGEPGLIRRSYHYDALDRLVLENRDDNGVLTHIRYQYRGLEPLVHGASLYTGWAEIPGGGAAPDSVLSPGSIAAPDSVLTPGGFDRSSDPAPGSSSLRPFPDTTPGGGTYRHSGRFAPAETPNPADQILIRRIWYGYIDGRAVCAAVFSPGSQQELSTYLLVNDGNGNLRSIHPLQGGEAFMIDYEVYGRMSISTAASSEAAVPGLHRDRETPVRPFLPFPVMPGFAGAQQDSLTGLANFGYRFYAPSSRSFLTPDPLNTGYDWHAYCDYDPVNYYDHWGLKRDAFVYFDTDHERLFGYSFDTEGDDTLDHIEAFGWRVTNNVMDREYPTLSGASDDANGINAFENGAPSGRYCIPQGFPPGSFEITGVYERNNRNIGAYFIATNATQNLDEYQNIGKRGQIQWELVKDANGDPVQISTDSYGFHAGGYSHPSGSMKNNIDDNTWGCGRTNIKDNVAMANIFQEILEDGGDIQGCAY